MSFWKRLFVECNFFFFFTYNEKTNPNILFILSVYRCKKKFFTLIQTILYKLNICNVCSNVETQLKENTIYLHIVIFLCLWCGLSEIVLFHCRDKQVFWEGCFCDVMCVCSQMFPSRLSVSEWLSELVLAGRARLTLLLWRDPPFTAHLFAFTSMHLINTLVGCLRSCINVKYVKQQRLLLHLLPSTLFSSVVGITPLKVMQLLITPW